jgi:hypothetical protein
VDPLTKNYPFLTPYQYASNRPIDGVDLDGMEYMKTIPKFEYSGSWTDYAGAIDNSVINILNTVPTLWNSAVKNYESLRDGTWIKDISGEIKQTGNGIAETAKQFYHEPITTLTSPEAVEFFTEAYIGGKIFSVSPQRNLLKPNTELSTAANTAKIADEAGGEGVVYKRIDKTGKQKDYIGQAKSEKRYEARQKEHQRANKDAEYEFTEIDRGKPGKDLNQKEQHHLDKHGGPTNKSNPNGGTSNKKNVIKKD